MSGFSYTAHAGEPVDSAKAIFRECAASFHLFHSFPGTAATVVRLLLA
ncbi:hypothetical protein [Burkholderia sp. MSMB1589WGS]|nr:hypothetical protein [Burkholderia sp. MSMB1589WGS]